MTPSPRIFVGVLLLLCAAWIPAVWFAQRQFVFPRSMARGAALPAPPPDAQVLWIETPAGKVEAWYFRAGNTLGLRGPVALFAHGNAELIDGNVEIARQYNRLGVHALLVEYRGYGRSAGTPSEQDIVADFAAARALVGGRPEVDDTRWIYHGRSLGGGVACALARRAPPAALVLQSTFTSIDAMAPWPLLPAWLVRDHFDNLGTLRALDRPVLVFHGTHDTIVPVAHGRTLAAAGKHARLVEVDSDHNDFPAASPEVWAAIEGFLRENGDLS